MRKLIQIVMLVCGLVTTTSTVFADEDAERAVLARLTHELALLGTLVDDAESQANPSNRVRFQYSWLRTDIGKIRQGIDEYIKGARVEPRVVSPLKGDYSR